MSERETLANLQELGVDEYNVLKETYCRLQGVLSDVNAMLDRYAAEGTPPDFNQVEALQLQTEELYEDLERFILPVCSPGGCGPSICTLEH